MVTRGEKKGKRRSLSVGYQRREGRSFAYWLVRYLWHSKQAGFAGISFSFSFLAVFQSWCLLIVCFFKKNMFLLLSRTCVFFLFWQQVASLLLFRSWLWFLKGCVCECRGPFFFPFKWVCMWGIVSFKAPRYPLPVFSIIFFCFLHAISVAAHTSLKEALIIIEDILIFFTPQFMSHESIKNRLLKHPRFLNFFVPPPCDLRVANSWNTKGKISF